MRNSSRKGKILSLEPTASTLFCSQCGSIGNPETGCPNCGSTLLVQKQITEVLPLEGTTAQGLSEPYYSLESTMPQTTGEPQAKTESESTAPQEHDGGQDTIPPSTTPMVWTASPKSPISHPIFWGRGGTLFGIFIVNTLFTLLTLGVYSFWGRVRIRQFLSSQTSFAKIRFSYHGTGMELLKGWAKALLVFGLPYAFLSFVPIFWEQVPTWIPNLLAGIMVLCFIPIAVVGSHRYRLSRTSLGTIRFSFRGRVSAYMKIWFMGTILTLLTAGLYYPFFENARRAFLVTHSYIGNRHFTYEGTGLGLVTIYAKAFGLLMLLVLGLIGFSVEPEALSGMAEWAQEDWLAVFRNSIFIFGLLALLGPWFYLQVAKQRYFWNHSAFGDARFQFTASTWNLLELRLTNFFMLIFTLGLAWPWVQVRNLQFLFYYLSLRGPLDFQRIEQEALDASPTGEELAGYFDAGFALG